MEIKVANLELFSIPFRVSIFWNIIYHLKLSVLDILSKQYPDAHFSFYNVLGEYGTYDKVEEILSVYFKNFDIYPEKLDFNSSPINNVPVIEKDGTRQNVDCETLGIYYLDNLNKIPKMEYTKNILVIKEFTDKKKLENLDYTIISQTKELDFKNLFEKNIIENVNDDTTKAVLLDLLRGGKVC
ncbi:hypothetical protein SU69_02470 [Thermosipho melanesiensis]|uniref:Uncharacterized protein n=2 Tax=Thermosipho melanesiensis TaxID=46541 RepID=A6LK96_THEM4|nr:hypothetical protein [Thermosipho melanesiensis]ABR30347.1 hypothetical protein Tmel_0480 [Thermosipho melanesiensis BI429]APT73513.1 hypothetical protein BW47_02580 [Thermosipho melanesiensis]OOC37463.1 hypothetical protein SU68_02485 [Thermosipho melanesiensis]OOC39668.1 hypothetical protein SU69_02470 [Thermosipho melanesiensis]OOC39696.1 hypothetical protein SU70_02465 [Thermosipho melanesiensis]